MKQILHQTVISSKRGISATRSLLTYMAESVASCCYMLPVNVFLVNWLENDADIVQTQCSAVTKGCFFLRGWIASTCRQYIMAAPFNIFAHTWFSAMVFWRICAPPPTWISVPAHALGAVVPLTFLSLAARCCRRRRRVRRINYQTGSCCCV